MEEDRIPKNYLTTPVVWNNVIYRVKDKLVSSPGENGGGQDAQKDLHSKTWRGGAKGETQERLERRSRKRSLSAGSEKIERVGDGLKKIDGYFSTDQTPQWAVVPMEEEEEKYICMHSDLCGFKHKSTVNHMYIGPCIIVIVVE